MTAKRLMASRRSGFTLIEILVVVFIVGMIAMVVAVNFAPRFGLANKATRLTHRLEQMMRLLQDQAIFTNQQLGMSIVRNQLRFYEWRWDCENLSLADQRQCYNTGQWEPFDLRRFIRVGGIDPSFTVQTFSEVNGQNPQIIFYAAGEMTPFTIEIRDTSNKPYYRMKGSNNGDIEVIDLGRIE